MQITDIDIPELPAFGLKAIRMERLGRVVVLAGKNGAGKTRLLGRLNAWTNEKLSAPGNALRFKLTDIGERERVDVILTNPPFGGEEERGIQGNFPEDKQTSETALLFLQLIMRKLRRVPPSRDRDRRRVGCAIAFDLGQSVQG